jgi:tetratricopeptide (TPR) repeat protein
MSRYGFVFSAAMAIWMLALGKGGYAADSVGGCGRLENAYGPFDYTNAEHVAHKLPIVEKFHFTSDVEHLVRGASSSVPGDLDYTLRAFPNHHRALSAMANYQLTHPRPSDARYYSADCYFLRAIAFKPTDAMVHEIYGVYLHSLGKYEQALQQYRAAVRLMPDLADAYYNLGLLYADMQQYQPALEAARHAYDLGYPLPGLRTRLQSLGVWKDQ